MSTSRHTPPNGDTAASLLQLFQDWQQAQTRLHMAQQTLLGAQRDALMKEARFKGAAAIVYGAEATFDYSEKTGLTFKTKRAATRIRKI